MTLRQRANESQQRSSDQPNAKQRGAERADIGQLLMHYATGIDQPLWWAARVSIPAPWD